jgi:hypothetical protein
MSSVRWFHPGSSLRAAFAVLGSSLALAGCGGGGDDAAAVAPPPTETASGLPEPTGSLPSSAAVARALVLELQNALSHAALGVASRAMGSFTPGIDHGMAELYDCPGGGTASFQPGAAADGAYVYSACVIEGVSYTGTGQVQTTLHNGELERYTIDQSGITAVIDGVAHPLEANVDCYAPGDGLGQGRESPQHVVGPVLCVGRHGGVAYGADFELHDGVISGSMQWSSGSDLWNAYAWDVGADSGSAYIAAASGTAGVRRRGAGNHQVAITADGRTDVFEVGP